MSVLDLVRRWRIRKQWPRPVRPRDACDTIPRSMQRVAEYTEVKALLVTSVAQNVTPLHNAPVCSFSGALCMTHWSMECAPRHEMQRAAMAGRGWPEWS